MKLARLWRASCFATSAGALVLAGGWIYQAHEQTIETRFVLVDKKTGDADEVTATGILKPPTIMMDRELRRFIMCAFGESSDQNANIVCMKHINNILSGEQPRALWNSWKRETKGTATERMISSNDERKIIVQTTNSDNIFNARWTEGDWVDGHPAPIRQMFGTFTFEYRQPERSSIFNHKSGLFIVHMQFQKEE